MPTALTPYRLYQIAKYAWAEYAFPSIHQAVSRLRVKPGAVTGAESGGKIITRDGALQSEATQPNVGSGSSSASGRISNGVGLVSARALAPAGSLVGLKANDQTTGSVLRDRKRSGEVWRSSEEGMGLGGGSGARGMAPRVSNSVTMTSSSAGMSHGVTKDASGAVGYRAFNPASASHSESACPPPIPGDTPRPPSHSESSTPASSNRLPHEKPDSSSSLSPSSSSDSKLHTSPPQPDTTHNPNPNPNPNPKPNRTSLNDIPTIRRLLADSTLFTPDFKAPRNVVVLCHGLYGFSTATPIPLFPSLKLHYWHTVLKSLRDKLGCKVMVVGVNGTGSIEERANQMDRYLERVLPKGTGVNFVAHSMGGLDCRYLITHLKPQKYKPLSLTMIGTPNRGSPFMDWCAANIGVGTASMMEKAAAAAKAKLPPYSLSSPILSRSPAQLAKEAAEKAAEATASSTGLMSIPSMFGHKETARHCAQLDHPAYGNLTTHFLNETFNPETPDDPNVKYTSTGGRISKMSVLHPLWFPKLILDAAAERGYAEEEGRSGKDYEGNDGLVSVSSAKWGEWMGVIDNAHHWDLRGEGGLWPQGGSLEHKPEGRPDPNAPDGWDWKAMQAMVEKEEDSKAGSPGVLSIDRIETLKKGAQAITQALDEQRKSIGKVATDAKGALPDLPGSWDMAQVGQVVDWVGGLMPGTGEEQKVGSKQMADARKEKEKQEADLKASGTESWAKSAANMIVDRLDVGGTQTGETGQRSKGTEEKRKEKEKFEVGRFYGALMVKIREDGF